MSRFYGRRRDDNHWTIIAAFKQLGCSVIDVSQTPCGFDILVGYGGLTMPVEIKTGPQKKAVKKLTAHEKKVHGEWTGGARLVTDGDAVAETANLLRRWHGILSQHSVNSCAGQKSPASSPP